jgi:hypothetical protein
MKKKFRPAEENELTSMGNSQRREMDGKSDPALQGGSGVSNRENQAVKDPSGGNNNDMNKGPVKTEGETETETEGETE